MALGNVLALPKYLHEYATIQPYGIIAGEASFIAVMLRLEYSHLQAMRGNPQHSAVGYLNWGASAVVRAVVLQEAPVLEGMLQVQLLD